jgi:hypothetical protein
MGETKLIRLADGTLVEVLASPGDVKEISGGLAEKVSTTFDKIDAVIVKVCRPILNACAELGKETNVDQAEVDMGISLDIEGNGSIEFGVG